MRLRLSPGVLARVQVNRPYTPGRDTRLDYAIELDATDYPLGTTIASASLVIAQDFGLEPLVMKTITPIASASGQITDTGADGTGALYFALGVSDLSAYRSLGPLVFEVVVIDSRGLQGSLDIGSLVAGPSTTGKPVDHVTISNANFTLAYPNTLQLTATTFDDQGNVLVGRVIVWSTSDPTIATVDGTGLVSAVAPGAAIISATSEGQVGHATATISVGIPVTLEQLEAVVAAAQPGVTQHATEAGRGHTLTLGNKATVTDVKGSSTWDLGIHAGAGFKYDPATNLFGTEAANDASAGVDAMQTGQTAFLAGPTVVGHSYTVALLVETHANPNSYNFGILNSADSLAIGMQPSPGGQDTRWTQLNIGGAFGSSAGSGRGELPLSGGNLQLILIDFVGYNSVLDTPLHAERVAMITGGRDLVALAHGEGSGWADATMRLVVGRGWPGFDQPGSDKFRDHVVWSGMLQGVARDAAWAWAQAHGVVENTLPHVVLIGNSYLAGTNVGDEAIVKPLLAQLGTRAQFSNLGISGSTAKRLQDRIPFVDFIPLSNHRRPKIVVVWFEFLNQVGTGNSAAVLADSASAIAGIRALLRPTDKIIVPTCPVRSSDPGWLASQAAVNAAMLADTTGTYGDSHPNWGDPAWIWGQVAVLSDGTRMDGSLHPTSPLGYGELGGDAARGLAPFISAVIP